MDQTTILRRMTGKKRLEQAFKLSDLVRELSLKNITSTGIRSKKEIQKELQKRVMQVTSERHMRDCVGIVEVQREKLDAKYLHRWAKDLRVTELLNEISKQHD